MRERSALERWAILRSSWPNIVGSNTAIPGFPLAGIGQLVAVVAGKDASSVEDRYAPIAATCGAKEPWALPAEVARRQVEIDGTAFVLPVLARASVSVAEGHPVPLSTHADGRRHLALA